MKGIFASFLFFVAVIQCAPPNITSYTVSMFSLFLRMYSNAIYPAMYAMGDNNNAMVTYFDKATQMYRSGGMKTSEDCKHLFYEMLFCSC